MVVKHEIKSQLAKLLATEDLIVEHKKVDTAQFNVHTRVLILPNWDKASNNVYDMLVGHEVGHALYTPDEWDYLDSIPQQFVNIVEDARVEKLMKRKYPGLAKSFYNGYNELNDNDFFDIENEDLNTFNIADRTNLYFKIGSFVPIYFSTTEKQIVSIIEKCETFDDVKKAALMLYEYCKKEVENNTKEDNVGEQKGISMCDEKDLDEMTDEELLEELEESSSNNDPAQLDTPSYCETSTVGGVSDLEIKTLQSLEDSLKDLNNKMSGAEHVYVELPKVDLRRIIISNTKIHSGIAGDFIEQEEDWLKSEPLTIRDIFGEADGEFVKFKKSAQKEVNYMVKEFECKKSADAYARATTARTGVLDTTKLHTYKYNEDIFRKVSIIPDGKNHGLVFILDWSGSMSDVMLDTIKQLYNLLWFCKKVNIPFEVYAFTHEYPSSEGMHRLAYEKKVGIALIEETFSLMNLFSSRVNAKTLDQQMKNIFRIALAFGHQFYVPYNVPIGMNLSGTPLNEALISLHQILPEFKKEHNLQKVQCVILTDGEAAPLRYSKEFQRNWESNPFMGSQYINDRCVLRNRRTGHTYSCEGMGYWADVTDLLLHDLRQSYPQTNFIGIRVLTSRDAGQFIRRYIGHSDEYDKVMKSWKREKSFAIKNSGYHTYFGFSANALGNDDEFDVVDDATKAQIKRAFVKSLKCKKMNKRVLGEFMELIA